MYLKDPKTGEQSVTLTAFVVGFGVATLKLLLSGLEITSTVKLAQFSGSDFAAVVGAVGAVYWARRNAGSTE
jgi:hypothetical protein